MRPSIAWIVYDMPYPPTSGGKMRAYNLIKHLSQDFDIHLFSFYRRESQLNNLDFLKPFVSQIKVYKRRWVWDLRNLFLNTVHPMPLLNISYLDGQLKKDLESAVREKRYDIFHFEFLGAASYLPLISELGGRTVMGNENIEHQIYSSYAGRSKILPLIPLFRFDVAKMRSFERKLWATAGANVAVSESDAEFIKSLSGKTCAVVPNAVEIKDTYPLVRGRGPVAFFSGNLNYRQNRDAVIWFCEEIAPAIKAKIPEFRLLVLSNLKPDFSKKYKEFLEINGDESATFDSFVPKVKLFVAPVRIKSGTNLKVLQAAACGLPIVGTTPSFAGYDFKNKDDVIVADDAEKFSAAVINIMEDEKMALGLLENSFKKVKKYSWMDSAKILRDAYFKILS